MRSAIQDLPIFGNQTLIFWTENGSRNRKRSLIFRAMERWRHIRWYHKLEDYFLNMNESTPASFSFIFGLLKQTIQFLQQINVKKGHVHPVYGAGIQTHISRLP